MLKIGVSKERKNVVDSTSYTFSEIECNNLKYFGNQMDSYLGDLLVKQVSKSHAQKELTD